MSIYNNILVAVDISDDAEQVLSKAIEMATKFSAEITLIHVVEPVVIDSSYDLTPPINIDLEQNLTLRANDFLAQLSKKMQLTNAKSIVAIGGTKYEIHRICTEENIDLLITGTHGRHGLSLLLGSTSNSVLHGTECDVLSVKI